MIILAAGIAGTAAPAFIGSQSCRRCHSSQFATQSASHHARALRPIVETDIPERLAETPLQERSGVKFAYSRKPNGLAVTVTKGEQAAEALLEWAFGSGSQAVTPVGSFKGAFFEHRISYYRAPAHPARTIGHSGTPSPTAEAALGIRQDPATITRCFQCHATGVRSGPGLAEMTPGVTCERCHGPGSEHAANPGAARLKRTQAVSLCADCHQIPGKPDEAITRFQMAGLTASSCFRVSGTMTCVTCHDPHRDADRTAKPYVDVCRSCHATPAATASACRRNRQPDCLPCHMPKGSPLPFLTFTDHQIRVLKK